MSSRTTSRQILTRSRSGATSVELAVVLPVIFLLFFGFWEWSRVEMIRQAATTASFEAARTGTLPSSTPADMQAVAENVLATYFISGATITPTIDTNNGRSDVTISVPIDANLWLGAFVFNGQTVQVDYSLQTEVTPD
jgi:Flp pilus assembly protein TadG